MTHWIVLKTAPKKELSVTKAVADMGYPAWCPVEMRYSIHKRKTKVRRLWETPVLPQMAFAALPVIAHGDLASVRYPVAIARDTALQPLLIASCEIQAFRDELETHNANVRRAYHRATTPRLAKAKRFKLEPELRDILMSALFGTVSEPMEEGECRSSLQ